MLALSFLASSLHLFVCINGLLINQTIPIESDRDIGTTFSLSIDSNQELMTLTMIGPEDIWMGVILGAEEMDGPAYIYYFDNDNNNEWVLAERLLEGTQQGAGQLIEVINPNDYRVNTQNGVTRVIYERSWSGSNPTSFSLSDNDLSFPFGFARGVDGILAYHGNDGRSHAAVTLRHLCCTDCIEGVDGGCPDDRACEELVCTDFNQQCCNDEWREECTSYAQDICINTSPQNPTTPSPQIEVTPSPTEGGGTCCNCLEASQRGRGGDVFNGCSQDQECENIVCDIDSFCCGGNNGNGLWDNLCVNQANAICSGEDIPICCSCLQITNGQSGCDQDITCENAICNVDAFCCGQGGNNGNTGFWDNICVGQAVNVCNGDPLPSANDNN